MLNSFASGPRDPFVSDSFTQLLQRAAIFGEKRHEVLVGNIANIDTPTYKTRDLDTAGFQNALAAAIEARRSPPVPGDYSTHPYLAEKARTNSLSDPILAMPRNITFQDANNRSIEQETSELTKNLMRQSFLIEVLSSQFRQLEAVVTERI